MELSVVNIFYDRFLLIDKELILQNFNNSLLTILKNADLINIK